MCVNGDGRCRRFRNIYRRGSLHTTPKIETVKNFLADLFDTKKKTQNYLILEKKWPHNFTNSFLISQIIKNRILNIHTM